MNGTELLPGPLDDPDDHLPSLPHTFTDFYIAPLQRLTSSRNLHASLITGSAFEEGTTGRLSVKTNNEIEQDVLQTPIFCPRVEEAKKPHLAISQLVDAASDRDPVPSSLPSFVSLSAVERSPIPPPSAIYQYKRPRLDADVVTVNHEVNRTLPRPAAKDDKKTRPVPLLPAMVTGLHEPPPSAGLLPSMDPDARPSVSRTSSWKLKVKDILSEPTNATDKRRGHAAIETGEPEMSAPIRRTQSNLVSLLTQSAEDDHIEHITDTRIVVDNILKVDSPASFDERPTIYKHKDRRPRRVWSDKETSDLLEGVAKHGTGKWIAILSDKQFEFDNRTSVDLKDRYRVWPKDKDGRPLPLETTKVQSFPNERTKVGTSIPASRPRKRTRWSKNEDEALVMGISIHGFKWTNIHRDPSLQLGHRLPLVLKDRARSLIPDLYSRESPVSHQPRKRSTPGRRFETSSATPGAATNQNIENSPASKTDYASGAGQGTTTEPAGLTLPRLDLEDDDLDWNNTLPPLLEWDELGM